MSNLTPPSDGLEAWLDEKFQTFYSEAQIATNETGWEVIAEMEAEFKKDLLSKFKEVERAYGGCHNCYGKGYATHKTQHTGYGTDGDIGGYEGGISGGNPNTMKFCKCPRGQQLEVRVKEVERDTRSTVNSEWQVLAEGITFLRDSVKEAQNTRKKE